MFLLTYKCTVSTQRLVSYNHFRPRVYACVCMCVRPRGHKLLVALLHMIGRIIAAGFQFRFMALAIDVIDPSNEMRRQLQPNKTKVRLY